MAKKKMKEAELRQVMPEVKPEVPEDLKNKIQALTALATIGRLLQEGHFPYKSRELLAQSFMFIEGMHAPLFEETKKHPMAHLVPNLLPVEAQDGATKEA